MRRPMVSALLAVMTAGAAAAQEVPVQAPSATPAEPSVAGYLCTFAGKCGDGADAAPTETMAAPRTKGFRLARAPVAATGPATASAATASLVRPAHAHATPPAAGHRAASLTVAAAPVAPGARPRADLLIGFERNSAQLSAQGIASARVFAQSLVTPELAGKRFLIAGHTDSRGPRALNLDLSRRRAAAVADFLVGQGVDRARLTTRGTGPDEPLPGHPSADPDNRRVEAELAS